MSPQDGHLDLLPVVAPGSFMFKAGDPRVNEQLGLTSMHTLFVREHNRLAQLLAQQMVKEHHVTDASELDTAAWDDALYDMARKIVSAQIQKITYEEFLPTLMGSQAPGVTPEGGYNGYDKEKNVDPFMSVEFATAAFRFGHTMLSGDLLVYGRFDTTTTPPEPTFMSLRDLFFRPQLLHDDPALVDDILWGLVEHPAELIDTKVVPDVREFLFANTTEGGPKGIDLVALNIHRGRDHGLCRYNEMRAGLGLAPKMSFAEVTTNPDLQVALESVYCGGPDQMDLWVGCLAEDHMEGAHVGELLAELLKEQFVRLRDGDEYFYMAEQSQTDLAKITAGVIDLNPWTFANMIAANTNIITETNGVTIRPNVFVLDSP